MKSPNYSKSVVALAMSLVLNAASYAQSRETVDTELLFLVDVSDSVSSEAFSDMMLSYANAMESGETLEAISGGKNKSIAASLIFFSDEKEQSVGIDWQKIDSYETAKIFGETLRKIEMPNIGSELSNTSSALDLAVKHFGFTKTPIENPFTSNYQAVDIMTDNYSHKYIYKDKDKVLSLMTQEDQASRDSAAAAGVDSISVLAVNEEGNVAKYYKDNVSLGEVSRTELTGTYGAEGIREEFVLNNVKQGARTSFEAVPEPSSVSLLGLGALSLILRRKRA